MSNLDPTQQAANAHMQERLKRRISSPQAMAPNLRSRQLHVMTWAVSLRKIQLVFPLALGTRQLTTSLYDTALVGYVALFADFGEQEHCFSPVSLEWVFYYHAQPTQHCSSALPPLVTSLV